jgi:hypothetical protein
MLVQQALTTRARLEALTESRGSEAAREDCKEFETF